MTTQPIPTTTDDLITELEYAAEEYSSVSPGEGDILMRAAERIRELEQSQAALRRGIGAVAELIDNSSGVAGLHLNGDTATWGELRTGGRFEEWLREFDEAQEASQ